MAAFLTRFTEATTVRLTSADVVDAETSVSVEQLLYAWIEKRLADGSLTRMPELCWDEVQAQLNEYFNACDVDLVTVYMSHHPDFAFRMPASES
jgi:hypothetical protein